jgi:hypothetical protein
MNAHNDCSLHDGAQALEKLQLALKIAFTDVMRLGGMTPLAALNLSATAVGTLYGEIAAAHRGANRCTCGWEPRDDADVEAMTSSLAFSATGMPSGLQTAMHVGHA